MKAEGAVARLAVMGELRLRRAWPRDGACLTLEYVDPGGAVVAGRWHPGRDEPELVAPGADRRLPGLAPLLAQPGTELVAHRAGRRATVRMATRDYAKIVRPRDVAAVVAAIGAARRAPGGPAVPPVLDVVPADGVVVVGALGGKSLHDRLGDPQAAETVADLAWRLRGLHAGPAPEGARPRTAAGEAAALERWLERLAPFDAALCERARRTAEPFLAALRDLPPVVPATVHGDLHDKQVFSSAPGTAAAALIDLDTLAPGDPAIDVANLAAHFTLRALQGRLAPDAANALDGALLHRYGTTLDPARLDVLRRTSLVRLACVYAFRPARPELPDALLAASAQA